MILVIKTVIAFSANEMNMCINRNARPNNNQLITYQRVRYLLRIQQYPVNNTYNTQLMGFCFFQALLFNLLV